MRKGRLLAYSFTGKSDLYQRDLTRNVCLCYFLKIPEMSTFKLPNTLLANSRTLLGKKKILHCLLNVRLFKTSLQAGNMHNV